MEEVLGSDPKEAPSMIPVIGFATLSRFDLAERLLRSIDYPVRDLVIVNNSGSRSWVPVKPDLVERLWHIEVPFGLGANGAWNLIIKSTPFAPYWVIPNDDSHFAPGALKKISEEVDPNAFNFVNVTPAWSCVIPGEGAILRAGLWDEAFHPVYFDDDDLDFRMRELGIPYKTIEATVYHDNSSTLKSGFQGVNLTTFSRNQKLFEDKKANREIGARGWSLRIRRDNRWD